MIYHVEVNADDFATGRKKNTYDCAFARGIQRATGAKLVAIFPRIYGTLPSGKLNITGYGFDLLSEVHSNIDENFTNRVLAKDSTVEQRAAFVEEWKKISYFSGELPDHVVSVIRAFDAGNATPTTFSFPLEISDERTKPSVNTSV